MAQVEKHFTLVCQRCWAQHIVGVSELPMLRARPSVYRWPCLVCEYMVEMATKPLTVLEEPRRLKPDELRRLRGKPLRSKPQAGRR